MALKKFLARQKATLSGLASLAGAGAGKRQRALQDIGAQRQARGLKELKFMEKQTGTGFFRAGPSKSESVSVTQSRRKGLNPGSFIVKRTPTKKKK